MNNPDELLLGPIVGGINHEQAFLWGRADGQNILHAWIGESPDMSDAHLGGKSLPLRSDDGFAGIAPVNNLNPNTQYYYHLDFSDTPPEVAPATGATSGYPSFRTFPTPGERLSFNFAFGSCFRPANMSISPIFTALANLIQPQDLRFLLMIGDQIYADDFESNGIQKIATTLEDYRAVYRYIWSHPDWKVVTSRIPIFMMMDDHEVDDDWRWLDFDRTLAYIPWWDMLKRFFQGRPRSERRIPQKRVQDALQAYWEHQGMHSPVMITPPRLNTAGQYELAETDPGSLAYTFEYGAAAFFVLDTRSMRVRGPSGSSMLGAGQWQALESWLLQVKDQCPVKFIVSSSSVFFRMGVDIPLDRWSGFPEERDRLLEFISNNEIYNVYFLSGDLHAANAIEVVLRGKNNREIKVWEFCSTPFEQKPNRLAKLTRLPVRSPWIKRQECRFVLSKNNFGVVKVDLAKTDQPAVQFLIIGEDGQVLGEAGSS